MLLHIGFNREGLLAPSPTPKLEVHPSSAVRDCLFNLFASTLLIGGRSSIRNLRTRHAVVTGTHYIDYQYYTYNKYEWEIVDLNDVSFWPVDVILLQEYHPVIIT